MLHFTVRFNFSSLAFLFFNVSLSDNLNLQPKVLQNVGKKLENPTGNDVGVFLALCLVGISGLRS